MSRGTFDGVAESYDEALSKGLALSGENKHFFARGRLTWLARCLAPLREHPRSILDYGCGTGTSVPLFQEILGAEKVVGIDVSARSLDVAKHLHGSKDARFMEPSEYQPRGELDLAFCNGLLHHIAVADRPAALSYIHRSLRPGGLFALWDNNPWNPGARWVMRRISFDADAIPLSAMEARREIRRAGFEILRTDFLFIFPRPLRFLRALEPMLSRLPLGAQFQVLCRKPKQGQTVPVGRQGGLGGD